MADKKHSYHSIFSVHKELEANYAKLISDHQTAHTTYVTAEKECNELKRLRDELASYMGMEKSQEKDMDKDRKQSLYDVSIVVRYTL